MLCLTLKKVKLPVMEPRLPKKKQIAEWKGSRRLIIEKTDTLALVKVWGTSDGCVNRCKLAGGKILLGGKLWQHVEKPFLKVLAGERGGRMG